MSVVAVDVMLPYYGDSAHFRAAVRSVLTQTSSDWRLICVDDAHPDETGRDWLLSLGDDRVHYLRNEVNLGVAGNFTHCLSLATAPWVTIMGSDDLMLPDHLAQLGAHTTGRDDVDVVQSGVRVIDENGTAVLPLADRIKRILRPRVRSHELILRGSAFAETLTRADWAYFPSLFWRTERAQKIGFDEQFEIALDLGLLLDVAIDGGALLIHDTTTFEYRRHRASVSMTAARSGERFAQEKRFFVHYAERFDSIGWKRAARIARNHAVSRLNALSELPGAMRSGGLAAARRLLGHVFR